MELWRGTEMPVCEAVACGELGRARLELGDTHQWAAFVLQGDWQAFPLTAG